MRRYGHATAGSGTRRALLSALGGLGVLGAGFAVYAVAAPPVPAPSITAKPANPTVLTSAAFSFTDSKADVTFECSLDGSAFSICASPKSYPGPLAGGSHTFAVRARTSSGGLSSATSFTWLIDLQGPSVTVFVPADGGAYNASGWSTACAGVGGVCGTATDPSGVSSVAISIREGSGTWWGGSSFDKTSEFFLAATGTTGWRYALAMPTADGQYTVRARATDGLGNTTAAAAYDSATFTIDTQPPPAPAITDRPQTPTNSESASFAFSDAQAGVTFLCKLDGGSFAACSSPKAYDDLDGGAHTFQVQARDAAGNLSSPASATWTVDTDEPPRPDITQDPGHKPTSAYRVTFAFTDSEAGVTFECRLDKKAEWSACASPTRYDGLPEDNYKFEVRAIDAAGNVGTSEKFEFKITEEAATVFTIGGSAPGLLYPGAAAAPVAVKLTNPNALAISVTALTVTLTASGLPTGCDAAWFAFAPSSLSPSNPVVVPAGGSVTLPAQGATAPTMRMLDSGTNQDACRNARLTLSYSGSAHS
jgi:hypothetical protein